MDQNSSNKNKQSNLTSGNEGSESQIVASPVADLIQNLKASFEDPALISSIPPSTPYIRSLNSEPLHFSQNGRHLYYFTKTKLVKIDLKTLKVSSEVKLRHSLSPIFFDYKIWSHNDKKVLVNQPKKDTKLNTFIPEYVFETSTGQYYPIKQKLLNLKLPNFNVECFNPVNSNELIIKTVHTDKETNLRLSSLFSYNYKIDRKRFIFKERALPDFNVLSFDHMILVIMNWKGRKTKIPDFLVYTARGFKLFTHNYDVKSEPKWSLKSNWAKVLTQRYQIFGRHWSARGGYLVVLRHSDFSYFEFDIIKRELTSISRSIRMDLRHNITGIFYTGLSEKLALKEIESTRIGQFEYSTELLTSPKLYSMLGGRFRVMPGSDEIIEVRLSSTGSRHHKVLEVLNGADGASIKFYISDFFKNSAPKNLGSDFWIDKENAIHELSYLKVGKSDPEEAGEDGNRAKLDVFNRPLEPEKKEEFELFGVKKVIEIGSEGSGAKFSRIQIIGEHNFSRILKESFYPYNEQIRLNPLTVKQRSFDGYRHQASMVQLAPKYSIQTSKRLVVKGKEIDEIVTLVVFNNETGEIFEHDLLAATYENDGFPHVLENKQFFNDHYVYNIFLKNRILTVFDLETRKEASVEIDRGHFDIHMFIGVFGNPFLGNRETVENSENERNEGGGEAEDSVGGGFDVRRVISQMSFEKIVVNDLKNKDFSKTLNLADDGYLDAYVKFTDTHYIQLCPSSGSLFVREIQEFEKVQKLEFSKKAVSEHLIKGMVPVKKLISLVRSLEPSKSSNRLEFYFISTFVSVDRTELKRVSTKLKLDKPAQNEDYSLEIDPTEVARFPNFIDFNFLSSAENFNHSVFRLFDDVYYSHSDRRLIVRDLDHEFDLLRSRVTQLKNQSDLADFCVDLASLGYRFKEIVGKVGLKGKAVSLIDKILPGFRAFYQTQFRAQSQIKSILRP